MEDVKIIVLAGGRGTRLWPLSRENYPKQFIKLFNEHTLFQKTIIRALKITDAKNIFIVSSKNYEDLIKRDLQNISPQLINNVIFEPAGKNTLPAVLLCSYSLEKDDSILVLPSDHFIEGDENFKQDVEEGHKEVQKNKFVIFGIKPNKPETGYGYIKAVGKCNPYSVLEFIEKPDIIRARSYLKDKSFYWNSGIFMFKMENFIDAVKDFEKEIYREFKRGKKQFLNNFFNIKSQSIDYGIMEKIEKKNVSMIEASFNWSDLGSFESLYDFLSKKEKENIILGNGDYIAEDSLGNLVINNDKLVVTLGISDTVIVETDDALLIMKRENTQNLKDIVNKLSGAGRKEINFNKQGFRPWGEYTVLLEGPRYKIKKITVNPNSSLSLQMHHHRSEHWIVIKGTAKVTLNDEIYHVHENESIYIPKSTKHRLENPGKVPLEIIEVQNGEYLEEDDIIRFLDNYNRK
ncbi:MAG: mannose-1-phosphate guanylyltransferase/mannose-6-phosphate isomerase [Proteobacteria bacterium]|nr:mannose-1-phosphate guanylyltransferase/mannose-6-phosphate isomerase [Pseudomonadota bacterium]